MDRCALEWNPSSRTADRCAPRVALSWFVRSAIALSMLGVWGGCSDSKSGSAWVRPDAGVPEAGSDGQVAIEAGPVCTPRTCAQMGLTCGRAPDGCNGVIECGQCEGGQTCGGAGANKCGTAPCQMRTCAQSGASCGFASDGCADVLDCGGCPAPASCGGGGKENECGCKARTCAQMGLTCGKAPDHCGGAIECGACEIGQTCGGAGANKCGTGSCSPKSCAQMQASCGIASDGCASTLECGNCSSPEVCGGSGISNLCGCLPKTCAQLGVSCGAVDDGCGKVLQCGGCDDGDPCTVGDACESGQCVPGAPIGCLDAGPDAAWDVAQDTGTDAAIDAAPATYPNGCPVSQPATGMACGPVSAELHCGYTNAPTEPGKAVGCTCAVGGTQWTCKTTNIVGAPQWTGQCPEPIPANGTSCTVPDVGFECYYHTPPGTVLRKCECIESVWGCDTIMF